MKSALLSFSFTHMAGEQAQSDLCRDKICVAHDMVD